MALTAETAQCAAAIACTKEENGSTFCLVWSRLDKKRKKTKNAMQDKQDKPKAKFERRQEQIKTKLVMYYNVLFCVKHCCDLKWSEIENCSG
jgi:hypothetical protein